MEILELIGKTKINKRILILSGGGISGILYAGVFRALDELSILKNIDTIVAVSAGSLYSCMYLMGYTSKEIIKFSEVFNYKKLSTIKNFDNLSLSKILLEYGFDNGDNFKNVFEKIAKQKNINPDITLLDFYKLNKIKFIIGVTNVDKLCEEYLSYELTPKIKLFDAIRATSSVPIFFTPVKLNDKLYIDGGVTNNFPINLYINNMEEIIGINISNPRSILSNDNFFNYLMNIINGMLLGWQTSIIRMCKNKHIFVINTNIKNMINFNISLEEKKRLIKLGFDTIMNSDLNPLQNQMNHI